MEQGLEGLAPLLSTSSAASAASAAITASNATTSAWYNLTAWATDVTRYAPLLEDIVWAGPRMFRKFGLLTALSDPLDSAAQQHATANPGSDLARSLAADPNIYNIMDSGLPTASARGAAGAGADPLAHASRLSLDGARGLGSVFSYATSKWALSCIAMAIILNRTHIFAATRRRLRFRWHLRLPLRLLPIVLLAVQACHLLQSIQCQTSADFAYLRWGDATKTSDLMFSHVNGFLNSMSSTLLFGATDQQSCIAVDMTPAHESASIRQLRGSLSLLWPLFGTFCLSHFLETVSCAVQGRPIAAETGLTLFEQSLAFAEADAAISSQLGWGTFSKSQLSGSPSSTLGGSIALTRSMILKRVNTPPEVLFVAFLSSMTHITSHVLGVFDLQAKYRLVNTGFWGICFMTSIVWSAFAFELENPSSQGLLRFPTVCIIGFVPHVLVLVGIAICLFVYGLALLLSALAPPASREGPAMSLRQRIIHAHENMQANVSLSEIRITREMDFYTALLRTGFAAITMASEAVYLNEDRGVSLHRHTWLEEARYREAEELQRQWMGMGLSNSRYDQIGAIGLIPVKGGPLVASNGYSRERAAQKISKGRGERGLRVGIGAAERSSRWLMALEFVLTIHKLVARVAALGVLWVLAALRIRARPAWLLWLARRPKLAKDDVDNGTARRGRNTSGRRLPLAFNGDGRVPRTEGIDVEAEFRRVNNGGNEEDLDQDLYKYWLKGGWWGSGDASGDFEPCPQDDDNWDTTSVVSTTTNGGDTDDEQESWESDNEGQRTPTQRSPRSTRDSTPFADSPLGMGDLARLLHPTSPEEREEAQNLAAHLQSDVAMTRSRYRRAEQLQRTRVLMKPGPGLLHAGGTGRPGRNMKLNPDEEERLLEQLLLSRRQKSLEAEARSDASGGWGEAATGAGGESPHCVVCQSSPRTVIVWPCRCLSLCDDCRVSLAMNNFDKCVCCRRDVMSFSRIFVP